MTENTHHDPAALDKLTEAFTVLPNENPASDAKRNELIDKPAFGQVFSDNMAHMTWTKGEGWSDRRIEPYAPLKMDPGASVLHYAQECFEGLKAYRHADGSTWLFRPDANAERFQNSAKRLYLPELPIDDFIGSVAALVKRMTGLNGKLCGAAAVLAVLGLSRSALLPALADGIANYGFLIVSTCTVLSMRMKGGRKACGSQAYSS